MHKPLTAGQEQYGRSPMIEYDLPVLKAYNRAMAESMAIKLPTDQNKSTDGQAVKRINRTKT